MDEWRMPAFISFQLAILQTTVKIFNSNSEGRDEWPQAHLHVRVWPGVVAYSSSFYFHLMQKQWVGLTCRAFPNLNLDAQHKEQRSSGTGKVTSWRRSSACNLGHDGMLGVFSGDDGGLHEVPLRVIAVAPSDDLQLGGWFGVIQILLDAAERLTVNIYGKTSARALDCVCMHACDSKAPPCRR